jgi:hypothetical protein
MIDMSMFFMGVTINNKYTVPFYNVEGYAKSKKNLYGINMNNLVFAGELCLHRVANVLFTFNCGAIDYDLISKTYHGIMQEPLYKDSNNDKLRGISIPFADFANLIKDRNRELTSTEKNARNVCGGIFNAISAHAIALMDDHDEVLCYLINE